MSTLMSQQDCLLEYILVPGFLSYFFRSAHMPRFSFSTTGVEVVSAFADQVQNKTGMSIYVPK